MRIARDVDQEVPESAIDEPRGTPPAVGDLCEGDFELVERVVARHVDARRLARRSHEEGPKQVRQAAG